MPLAVDEQGLLLGNNIIKFMVDVLPQFGQVQHVRTLIELRTYGNYFTLAQIELNVIGTSSSMARPKREGFTMPNCDNLSLKPPTASSSPFLTASVSSTPVTVAF